MQNTSNDAFESSSSTEDLLERLLPFGWFENLSDRSVRFVTDHAGSVPLFYAQHQGRVLAGSTPLEVAEQMVDPKLDDVSVADFLLNGTVCYPHTLFDEVYAVPPGAVTKVSANYIRSDVYYRPEEIEANKPVEVWGEMLRESVRKALFAGLDGKENIKVLFSGGEDSRALVSLLPKDLDCELITFADGYNREVRLAERAAWALGRRLQFVERPEGFYRRDLRERSRMVGGVSDVSHTHVYGELADSIKSADAVVGGFTSDTLWKSLWKSNISRQSKFGPERLISCHAHEPLGIAFAVSKDWLNPTIAAEVDERRERLSKEIQLFRPRTAGNWQVMWPLAHQQPHFAHYTALKNAGPEVVEPFFAPQVYRLAAIMPDQMRVDRKAFRAAFGTSMSWAGWLPASSGRIPRAGGHLGRWVEAATIISRRERGKIARAFNRRMNRESVNQGAWSNDHSFFEFNFHDYLSPEQVERLRAVMNNVLSEKEMAVFLKAGGGSTPKVVRNRALQIAYLSNAV